MPLNTSFKANDKLRQDIRRAQFAAMTNDGLSRMVKAYRQLIKLGDYSHEADMRACSDEILKRTGKQMQKNDVEKLLEKLNTMDVPKGNVFDRIIGKDEA